jgi:hypothetical protein
MAATGHEGETVLKVYFLDNSSKMLMVNYDVTAEEVCDMIAMRLGFKQPEVASAYFSLFESVDGNIPRRALGRTECVKDVQQGCAKIIYMMKLFMPTALKMVEEDPIMLHLQYVQSLHSVITGTHFHNNIPICVKLAALDFQLKYGPHNPKVHKIGFLTHRLYEFIPAYQLSLKEPLEWEEDIYAEHMLLLQRGELDAKLEYVKICQSWDCNGCVLFEVRQNCLRNHPPKVLIGINTNGVWVLHTKTREILELYKLSEVYRWGFKPGSNFYFEIKGTGGSAKGPIFEFGTTQGNRVSELLTDYANALLDELGLTQKNTETASAVLDGMINAEDVALEEKKQEIKSFIENEKDEDKKEAMKEEFYAIYIQSLWRGYKQRCEFESMIEDMEKQLFDDQEGGASELKIKSDEVEIAAVKMQSMWRGANVRSNLLKQLEELEENY